ncbi:MAG TPA: hypothetical protein VHH88_05370, partial [Verrucomicrobiae bacterium]|nr:hypothetical protein [Verrucomicrobiae bacterium]
RHETWSWGRPSLEFHKRVLNWSGGDTGSFAFVEPHSAATKITGSSTGSFLNNFMRLRTGWREKRLLFQFRKKGGGAYGYYLTRIIIRENPLAFAARFPPQNPIHSTIGDD